MTVALTGQSDAILPVIAFRRRAAVQAFVDVERGPEAAPDGEAGLRLAATQ